MTACTIRARIDANMKKEADLLFHEMGLTMSDGIRMFLKQVIAQKALPFPVKVPNATTRAAFNNIEARKGLSETSIEELEQEWREASDDE